MGGSAERLTIAVRVKPGSRAPRVGGSWGDPPELVVAVAQRAVDGAANAAVVAALASAFGVARSAVTLTHGARGRSKLVVIEGEPAVLRARLEALRQG